MTVISQEQIKDHIIHRFENLLLDSVTTDDNSEKIAGTFTLSIAENDSLGRDIFLKEKKPGYKTLIVPINMEVLALASIVSAGKLKPGEMAIFAGITNFERKKDFLAENKNTGEVEKISDKAGFLKFSGQTATEEGATIASGVMVAFFMQQDRQAKEAPEKQGHELPEMPIKEQIKSFGFKSPHLTVVDNLRAVSEELVITDYTYPTNHPFTKGHFPSNPLMMGVMQWTSVEDAVLIWAEKNNLQGNKKISCQATLYNTEGVIAADLKNIVCEVWRGVEGFNDQTETLSLKRISFKNMVKPGETIYTVVSNIKVL